MFPGNFEVLKIPARSMLLSAKSSISAMASTSATLAAREGCGEGVGCFGRNFRTAFTGTGVDIFFRPGRTEKSHRTCGSQPAGDDSFIIKTALTDIALSLVGWLLQVFAFYRAICAIRRARLQLGKRYWSSSPASDRSSNKPQSTPGSPRRGTPARHPAPAATNG